MESICNTLLPIEAAKRFKESAQQATKAQLKSMGFPDWLIEQAVQHADGLEAAINWCTEQSMGNAPYQYFHSMIFRMLILSQEVVEEDTRWWI